MGDREKRREDRNSKNWISWKQKEVFRWNIKYFSWLFKGYDFR